jgi:hypothetical protein
MKMLVVGAMGMLAVQALLVLGYLGTNKQDPIILNPDRGGMVDNGIVMATYCGPQSGKEMLDDLPANGRWDSWTKGQTILGRCTVSYHHPRYSPCVHTRYTFDRPCPQRKRPNLVEFIGTGQSQV